jgi:hypothetical protein
MEDVLMATAQKIQTQSTYHTIKQTSSGKKQAEYVDTTLDGSIIYRRMGGDTWQP